MSYLFTSESVSEGHPDKVADQISDALIDNFLAFDPNSKVACETLVTTGQVVLAGEVKSGTNLDVQKITPNEVFSHTTINSKSNDPGYKKSDFKPSVNFPEFHWNMSPALRHQIGGPEAFYLGQLWWRTETKIKFQIY